MAKRILNDIQNQAVNQSKIQYLFLQVQVVVKQEY